MAAHAEKDREEAENEVYKCDSVPPPADDEGYGKPTEVREMPTNLLELLKKGDKEAAVDADLADAADLANLIVSTRVVPTESGAPTSGVVAKGEEERDPRVPIAPPPARLPRTEIPPPASSALARARLVLDNLSSNVLFAGVVFGVALAYALLMLALR